LLLFLVRAVPDVRYEDLHIGSQTNQTIKVPVRLVSRSMLNYLQTAHVHELSHIGLRSGKSTCSDRTEVTAFTALYDSALYVSLCKPP